MSKFEKLENYEIPGFNHPARAKQLILFEDMPIGHTDYDAVCEYHNMAWLIYEVKKHGTGLDLGQRLALERDVEDKAKAGKWSIGIVVEHSVKNPDDPIWLKDCIVKEIKICNNPWREITHPMTASEFEKKCLYHLDNGDIESMMKWV